VSVPRDEAFSTGTIEGESPSKNESLEIWAEIEQHKGGARLWSEEKAVAVNGFVLAKGVGIQLRVDDEVALGLENRDPGTRVSKDAIDAHPFVFNVEAAEVLSVGTSEKEKSQEEKGVTKLIEGIEELLSCGICFELFKDPVTLSCSHTYCYKCLQDWGLQSNRMSVATRGGRRKYARKNASPKCPVCDTTSKGKGTRCLLATDLLSAISRFKSAGECSVNSMSMPSSQSSSSLGESVPLEGIPKGSLPDRLFQVQAPRFVPSASARTKVLHEGQVSIEGVPLGTPTGAPPGNSLEVPLFSPFPMQPNGYVFENDGRNTGPTDIRASSVIDLT